MALIPPFFFDCVASIGIDDISSGKREWIATGFLYGHFLETHDDGTSTYNVYLITNRHVFENLQIAYLRFNPITNERAREYSINLLNENGLPLWFSHTDEEIDVAAIPIDINMLKEHKMQVEYFRSNKHVANIDKLNELSVMEGDFIYTLGFPMGIVGGDRNRVIVRGGTIARICDVLTHTNKEYLIDAFVFPGNSGGPVISKPEALAIDGTKSQGAAYLIGIVKSYIPYVDRVYSLQTKSLRVTFEENSGLAAVHPVDFIQETINLAEQKKER